MMNALLMVGTGALALLLWRAGYVAIGTVAMAIPMSWQIATMSGWVAQQIANIFDDIGQVQDGMRSIAVPRQMPDPRSADFPLAAGRQVIEILKRTRGRAFVLFTSYATLRAVHAVAEMALEYPMFGVLPGTPALAGIAITCAGVALVTWRRSQSRAGLSGGEV